VKGHFTSKPKINPQAYDHMKTMMYLQRTALCLIAALVWPRGSEEQIPFKGSGSVGFLPRNPKARFSPVGFSIVNGALLDEGTIRSRWANVSRMEAINFHLRRPLRIPEHRHGTTAAETI
jgi:hypothetical protein